MKEPVLQASLPNPPWLDPPRWRLPGVMPLDLADWLIKDDAFAAQMALRDHLIATREPEVHALLDGAEPAALECLDLVLQHLIADPDYQVSPNSVRRPDGVEVLIVRNAPLLTLGRLTQADFCLMQQGPDGHILTGAILCFPAYWTLSEKIGRPLMRIHDPVTEYDANVTKRVQRLFDALHPDRLLWRANAHLHASPALFTPRLETDPESRADRGQGKYVRSERQVLRKLPKSGATVFSIHTYMVHVENLEPEAQGKLHMLVP